jgi:hypothetical protein
VAYRDDREAALARAASLQVELARSERELAETKARLVEVERERARLAALVPPAMRPLRPAVTRPELPAASVELRLAILLLAVAAVAVGALVIGLARKHPSAVRVEERPAHHVHTCTLQSTPQPGDVWGRKKTALFAIWVPCPPIIETR